MFQVEYPEVTNFSEDEHLSEEEKSDKQKLNPVPQAPSAAGTPSQQPAEAEEEESETDDPTSNGGNMFVSMCD